jgi:hypothetical protein
MEDVLLNVAVEISANRAKMLRKMKEGLILGDLETVLDVACDLCGIEHSHGEKCSRKNPIAGSKIVMLQIGGRTI